MHPSELFTTPWYMVGNFDFYEDNRENYFETYTDVKFFRDKEKAIAACDYEDQVLEIDINTLFE